MMGLSLPPSSFLSRLHPFAKLLMLIPVFLELLLTQNVKLELFFLLEFLLVLLFLGNILLRSLGGGFIWVTLASVGYGLTYMLSIRPELVHTSTVLFQVGPFTLYQYALELGIAMTLRMGTILIGSWIFTRTTSMNHFILALIQQVHLPYRIGYGILVAFRFLPTLRQEYKNIRLAQRLRGVSKQQWKHPFLALRRLALPLFAGVIRHAERVALSMDTRAFGVYAKRTYLQKIRFTRRDGLFCIFSWLFHGAVIYTFWCMQ